jgi:G3E family GTPase
MLLTKLLSPSFTYTPPFEAGDINDNFSDYGEGEPHFRDGFRQPAGLFGSSHIPLAERRRQVFETFKAHPRPALTQPNISYYLDLCRAKIQRFSAKAPSPKLQLAIERRERRIQNLEFVNAIVGVDRHGHGTEWKIGYTIGWDQYCTHKTRLGDGSSEINTIGLVNIKTGDLVELDLDSNLSNQRSGVLAQSKRHPTPPPSSQSSVAALSHHGVVTYSKSDDHGHSHILFMEKEYANQRVLLASLPPEQFPPAPAQRKPVEPPPASTRTTRAERQPAFNPAQAPALVSQASPVEKFIGRAEAELAAATGKKYRGALSSLIGEFKPKKNPHHFQKTKNIFIQPKIVRGGGIRWESGGNDAVYATVNRGLKGLPYLRELVRESCKGLGKGSLLDSKEQASKRDAINSNLAKAQADNQRRIALLKRSFEDEGLSTQADQSGQSDVTRAVNELNTNYNSGDKVKQVAARNEIIKRFTQQLIKDGLPENQAGRAARKLTKSTGIGTLENKDRAQFPLVRAIPYEQVVQQSEFRIKVFQTLINAAEGYPLIKPYPKSFSEHPEEFPDYKMVYIDPELANDLLEAFKGVALVGAVNDNNTLLERDVMWVINTVVAFNQKKGFSQGQPNYVSPQEALTAFLTQMKLMKQFADHTGMCCPDCQGLDPESCPIVPAEKLKAPSISVNGVAPALDPSTVPVGSDFSQNLASFKQGIDMFIDAAASHVSGIPVERLHADVVNLVHHFDQSPMNNSFKTAQMMDYLLNLIDMMSLYSPQNQLQPEIQFLAQLLIKFTDAYVSNPLVAKGEINFKSRFHMAPLMDHVVEALARQHVPVPSQLMAKITSVSHAARLDLDDDEERTFFTDHRILTAEPKISSWDVEIPFGQQLERMMGPLDVHTLTGFLGTGKTTVVKLMLAGKDEHGNAIVRFEDGTTAVAAMEINDAAGSFDVDEILNELESHPQIQRAKPNTDGILFFMPKEAFDALNAEFEDKYGVHLESVDMKKAIKEGKDNGDGDMVGLTGCICCSARDLHIQKIMDFGRGTVAGKDGVKVDIVMTEPTGIADGIGILNCAFVPSGRVFYPHLYVLMDPSVDRWLKLMDYAEHYLAHDPNTTFEDMEDNFEQKREAIFLQTMQAWMSQVGVSGHPNDSKVRAQFYDALFKKKKYVEFNDAFKAALHTQHIPDAMDGIYLNQLNHATKIFVNVRSNATQKWDAETQKQKLAALLKFSNAHEKVQVSSADAIPLLEESRKARQKAATTPGAKPTLPRHPFLLSKMDKATSLQPDTIETDLDLVGELAALQVIAEYYATSTDTITMTQFLGLLQLIQDNLSMLDRLKGYQDVTPDSGGTATSHQVHVCSGNQLFVDHKPIESFQREVSVR